MISMRETLYSMTWGCFIPHPNGSRCPYIVSLCEGHLPELQVEHLHCDIRIYVSGSRVEKRRMNTETLSKETVDWRLVSNYSTLSDYE